MKTHLVKPDRRPAGPAQSVTQVPPQQLAKLGHTTGRLAVEPDGEEGSGGAEGGEEALEGADPAVVVAPAAGKKTVR
jgi:hypothetical protein